MELHFIQTKVRMKENDMEDLMMKHGIGVCSYETIVLRILGTCHDTGNTSNAFGLYDLQCMHNP
jgi:hypothetical protein